MQGCGPNDRPLRAGVRSARSWDSISPSADGPQLIEINTSAGGAFINTELAPAQRMCCDEAQLSLRSKEEVDSFDRAVLDMFKSEWSRQRGAGAPAVMAVVDDEPE